MRRQLSCGTPQSSMIDMSPATNQTYSCRRRSLDRCQIMYVAIPSDYNIHKKATEKMSKNVDLQIECQRIWKNNSSHHGTVVECRTRHPEVPGSNPSHGKKKISHRSIHNNTTTNPPVSKLNT